MSCCCHGFSQNQITTLTTERLKVLKVIGEVVGQVVVENCIPINAVKIDHIDASIKDTTDHVFDDKIVKQGIIHKQVFYVDPAGIVHEIGENIPFMLVVDIPGVKRDNPFLEIENIPLCIETDHVLVPATCHEPGELKQKVVAKILVKVSEWVQLEVVVKPNFGCKVNSMNTIIIRS
jgi:hypothetical protein